MRCPDHTSFSHSRETAKRIQSVCVCDEILTSDQVHEARKIKCIMEVENIIFYKRNW